MGVLAALRARTLRAPVFLGFFTDALSSSMCKYFVHVTVSLSTYISAFRQDYCKLVQFIGKNCKKYRLVGKFSNQ